MLENTIDVIMFYDRDGNRTYVSPVVSKVLGYTPEILYQQQGCSLNHPDDHDRIVAIFRSIGPAHPNDKAEFRVRRSDGTYLWVAQSFCYIPEDGGVLTVARDIDAQKTIEKDLVSVCAALEIANLRLRVQAHEDGLTGLANRRCFDESLDTEFYRARREQRDLGVILIDVDCFKSYNDAYGHVAGDVCLRRVSDAIKSALTRPADHAARYGGEEMAVILPATDETGSLYVAERIRQAVADLQIKHIGNPTGYVTVSAGVHAANPTRDANAPTDMISAADRALYQAKGDGRNCIRSSNVSMRLNMQMSEAVRVKPKWWISTPVWISTAWSAGANIR